MIHIYPKCLLTICGFMLAITTFSQEMNLDHISTYHTGVFGEGALPATVDVLDISDPANPRSVQFLKQKPSTCRASDICQATSPKGWHCCQMIAS